MADETGDLFAPRGSETERSRGTPLAERMRPRRLDEVAGQAHLLGPGAPLRSLLEAGELPSLILWGPPGCGKTTLARLLADAAGARFHPVSAVLAGVKEVREAIASAELARASGRRTVLFVDEIHRFNRAQQDALLPHAERGTVILVGATTGNPSFEVNAPLLSRCRVLALEALDEAVLVALLERALTDAERGLGAIGVTATDEALRAVAAACDGDARRALGLLEDAVAQHVAGPGREAPLGPDAVREAAGRRILVHDRDREAHYDVVSALIKSLRASDPDAGLYWLSRMLAAGEDPLFVARRLVVFASEDVGNADPAALPLATSAFLAVERIGLPEGRIPLAQAVTYLACAPKSNASYTALGRAMEAVERHGTLPVPKHLRNAPTALMKAHGYGQGYRYAHDAPGGFVPDPNLPAALGDPRFYEPKDAGAETEIGERLRRWRDRRDRERGGEDS